MMVNELQVMVKAYDAYVGNEHFDHLVLAEEDLGYPW
jgi:hypothetical protein